MQDIITRPTWAEIDLDNLIYNYRVLKELCHNTDISCVVKANAYGHGAIEVSKALEAEGVQYFSVSSLQEGLELRAVGIKTPIMLLTALPTGYERAAIQNNIEATVFSFEQADRLNEICREMNTSYSIHIKLDTGMRRIGFRISDESLEEISRINSLEHINLKGVFTHFAAADEANNNYTPLQFQDFMDMVEKLENKGVIFEIKHVDNDAALFMYDYREDMVRLGIGLYGIFPSDFVRAKVDFELKPVMALKSIVTNIKTIQRGETVGYGQTYTAKSEAVIATVGIGYADGLPRLMSNKGSVIINGVACPIVGRVCMDQLMVDVTELQDVNIDDIVVIFGDPNKNEPEVGNLADVCDTISYEILSGVSRRIPRVYIKGGKEVNVVSYLNY